MRILNISVGKHETVMQFMCLPFWMLLSGLNQATLPKFDG